MQLGNHFLLHILKEIATRGATQSDVRRANQKLRISAGLSIKYSTIWYCMVVLILPDMISMTIRSLVFL